MKVTLAWGAFDSSAKSAAVMPSTVFGDEPGETEGSRVAVSSHGQHAVRSSRKVSAMELGMAIGAHCYEVLLDVSSGMTAELDVMDLQLDHGTTQLAPPAVPSQNYCP